MVLTRFLAAHPRGPAAHGVRIGVPGEGLVVSDRPRFRRVVREPTQARERVGGVDGQRVEERPSLEELHEGECRTAWASGHWPTGTRSPGVTEPFDIRLAELPDGQPLPRVVVEFQDYASPVS